MKKGLLLLLLVIILTGCDYIDDPTAEFRNENTIKGVDACVKSHESKIFPYNEATYFCLRKHEIYLRSVDEWKDFTLKLRIVGKEEAFSFEKMGDLRPLQKYPHAEIGDSNDNLHFELSIENPYVDAVITGADITLVFPEPASAVDASSYNLKVGGFPIH